MCYGKPDEILALVLQAHPPTPNGHGHTAIGDFDHFCAYSGCNPGEVNPEAFAWAKLAYISAGLPKT
ncbi:hypothetical protein B0G84_8662 [Paraburkholderia sp. BL8N3]|nr:hypothetical protein [Paraburkholderia sp. BL8N3]TCK32780.1 hypothetical protein B0G84_8662 [Paraburkholderia sp. BL8N3]